MTDDTTFGAANRPPFAQLPDWVVLADISNTAKVLYWHIAMHVNFQRGDRAAWPGRATLACRMGYSRADKVDPFIKELVDLGALKKVKRQRTDGGDASNHYLVSFFPPEGYPGMQSLTEAYLGDKAADAVAGQTPAPKSGPPSKPGKPRVPAARTPAPDSGPGGSPEIRAGGAPDPGLGGPRDEGPNKKNPNPMKMNHPDPETGRTDEASQTENNPSRQRELAATITAGLNLARLDARPKQVTQIRQALADVLARPGVDPKTVERYAAAKVTEARTVKYLLGAFTPERVAEEMHSYRPAPPPAPPCPTHPGMARRADGECSGCWTDRFA